MLLKQFRIRCVLTVALLVRLPLVLLGWLVAWTDLRLAKFNLWLTEKLTGQTAPPVHHKAVNAVEGQAGTGIPDLETIILKLSTFSPYKLNSLRRGLEGSKWGRKAAESSPDRHLYAVRRPTMTESLKRIENVFNAMPEAEFVGVRRRAKVLLGL